MEYSFYSVPDDLFLLTLAKLVEKVYGANSKAVIYSKDVDLLNEIDEKLWTYSTNAFIPHGFDDPDYQAVWLTTTFENKNGANVALLINDFSVDCFDGVERQLFFFSKKYDAQGKSAYERLKNDEKPVKYWNRSAEGWSK